MERVVMAVAQRDSEAASFRPGFLMIDPEHPWSIRKCHIVLHDYEYGESECFLRAL